MHGGQSVGPDEHRQVFVLPRRKALKSAPRTERSRSATHSRQYSRPIPVKEPFQPQKPAKGASSRWARERGACQGHPTAADKARGGGGPGGVRKTAPRAKHARSHSKRPSDHGFSNKPRDGRRPLGHPAVARRRKNIPTSATTTPRAMRGLRIFAYGACEAQPGG